MQNQNQLPPERASRILRAFAGELETGLKEGAPADRFVLSSRVAMICEILADHLEPSEKEVDDPS